MKSMKIDPKMSLEAIELLEQTSYVPNYAKSYTVISGDMFEDFRYIMRELSRVGPRNVRFLS